MGLYKRSQGRIARQVTFGVLAVAVTLGAWSLLESMTDKGLPFLDRILVSATRAEELKDLGWSADEIANLTNHRRGIFEYVNGIYRYTLPMLVFFGGVWMAFRVVNWPRFADFLIAVEAEMNKVSWPSRSEMFRSAMVVMITIFGLAAVLLAYDLFWQFGLRLIGVLPSGN
jgi:preprotein translocase subunit SecE